MASTPWGPVHKANRILTLSAGSSLQTIGAINHGMSKLSRYSQSYVRKSDRSWQNNSSSSIWYVRFANPAEMIHGTESSCLERLVSQEGCWGLEVAFWIGRKTCKLRQLPISSVQTFRSLNLGRAYGQRLTQTCYWAVSSNAILDYHYLLKHIIYREPRLEAVYNPKKYGFILQASHGHTKTSQYRLESTAKKERRRFSSRRFYEAIPLA